METIAQVPFRLKVSVGSHAFDAEGQETAVREQFALWVQAINGAPQPAPEKTTAISTDVRNGHDAEFEVVADDDGDRHDAANGNWNRAFKQDNDQLSLLVMPNTSVPNADSIILLIYGYQTLLKRDAVTSTELMEAAKWSGMRIDRIDRNLTNGHAAYVVKGGSRKGSRYSLNNRGLAYAQELLETMFD
jgi:hypothetical protein